MQINKNMPNKVLVIKMQVDMKKGRHSISDLKAFMLVYNSVVISWSPQLQQEAMLGGT